MGDKRNKIYFLVPYPLHVAPGQRFRFEHFLPYFKHYYIYYTISSFMTSSFYKILDQEKKYVLKFLWTCLGYLKRMIDVLRIIIFKYDNVFIYREATPFGEVVVEKILFKLGKKIIYDFDDAIFLPPLHVEQTWIQRLKNPSKIKEIIRVSNLVLVGNSYLKDFAIKYNSQVAMVPTLINTNFHIPKQSHQKERTSICLGWTGSCYTFPYLYLLKPVFEKLSAQYKHVYFKIIGAPSFQWENIPIKSIPWSLKNEISELQEIDIGLMPLSHDSFSQGKCGFKALQYMSLEIPAVCSSVGVNTIIIKDGVNGFLCDTEKEWIEKLQLLVENEDLRKKLGQEGRKTVCQYYSVDTYKDIFFQHMQRVVS